MKYVERLDIQLWHAAVGAAAWLYAHPGAVIVAALAICAGLIAGSADHLANVIHLRQQRRINRRNHAAIEREAERARYALERLASIRAQEILDIHFPGLQIMTMTPEAYAAVRFQLTAEGLWNV